MCSQSRFVESMRQSLSIYTQGNLFHGTEYILRSHDVPKSLKQVPSNHHAENRQGVLTRQECPIDVADRGAFHQISDHLQGYRQYRLSRLVQIVAVIDALVY